MSKLLIVSSLVLLGVGYLVGLILFNSAKTPMSMPMPTPVVTTQTTVEAMLIKITPDEYWLSLNVTVPAGYHIYSIYQEPGGPAASTISLDLDTPATMKWGWVETPNPTLQRSDVWPDIQILQLEGTVNWTAGFKVSPESKPVISGVIKVYPCGDRSCLMPQEIRFTTQMPAQRLSVCDTTN